jgi:hypothetical protein
VSQLGDVCQPICRPTKVANEELPQKAKKEHPPTTNAYFHLSFYLPPSNSLHRLVGKMMILKTLALVNALLVVSCSAFVTPGQTKSGLFGVQGDRAAGGCRQSAVAEAPIESDAVTDLKIRNVAVIAHGESL